MYPIGWHYSESLKLSTVTCFTSLGYMVLSLFFLFWEAKRNGVVRKIVDGGSDCGFVRMGQSKHTIYMDGFFYQISKLDFFCFCFLGISIFIYGLIIFSFKKCYYFASNMTNLIKFVIMLKMWHLLIQLYTW